MVVDGAKKLVAITSRKREDGTYTPITDCFFGGSLLMFATGDH